MGVTLWVPGPLPGLNELIAAAKGHGGRGYAYAKLKRSWTDTVILLARSARLKPVERVKLHFLWCERNRKRDPDNVAAGGRKLVLDGLVAAGVLPGDGWANIVSWSDSFAVGEKPGVSVLIVPA
jgi:hypothetical protein